MALVQLAGAILAALSVYLPWISFPGDSFNAFEVPVLILLDYDTTTRGVDLGILIVLLAGVALADLFVQSPTLSKITFGIGIALIAISLLFVVQLARGASASSQSLGDILGFAPVATIAAGAMVTAAKATTGAWSFGSR